MPDSRFDTASLRAARYRQRAAEMRRQIPGAVTKSLRTALLEMAQLYDAMA